ncbi:hypothetical protein CNR22_03990 [Sphingobacteriaceae bacterium]|nr:hypothetical protein CNR22_03990 [Sphingobacteriaceae bacterium]
MMSLDKDVVLAAHNISKKYTVKQSGTSEKNGKDGDFWALQDVSFELKRGEILGIIGTNGAGKSTILKILSEIIAPTSGYVHYKGSILSILDIGTGFHPDLSGYENIFLNASLLGMKKKQINEKVNEIIDFSGIKAHIHEPVKNYSNGMYLRLALSIALFTNNEIILLDEVVSVGDAEFRMKAIRRIKEQSHQGKACIMISHDLGSVMELCDTCLLLEKGKLIYSGTSKATVEHYFEGVYDTIYKTPQPAEHSLCRVTAVTVENETLCMDEPVRIQMQYEIIEAVDVRIVLKIRSYHGAVMTDSITFRPDYVPQVQQPGSYRVTCVIPANLFNAGSYMVEVLIANDVELLALIEMAAKFKVTLKEWEAGKKWNENNEVIPFRPLCAWKTEIIK